MPSVVGESVVRIGVDDRRLRSGLARTQKMATARVSAIGTGLKTQFSGIAASMGLLGIGAGIAGLVRSVVNFEDEMLKLAATMRKFGDADETIERIGKKARELGGSTQFTAGQVAAAMNELALGGLSANEQIAAIEGVLSGAAAGGLEMATVAKSVAVNLSAFNLEASESERIVDLFASAQTKSITTMGELIEAMRGVGPVAASANLKLNDTTAILATLAKTGLVGAEAGTSLGVAFTRLLLPSKEAKKIMDAAGFSVAKFSDEAGNITDPIALFEELAKANFTVAEGLEIFGARGRKFLGFLNTIRNTSDGTTNALRRIRDEITADTGIAGKQAEKRMSGTSGAIKTMISALQELGISILPPLIEGFVFLMKPVLSLIRAIARFNDAMGGFIGKSLAGIAALALFVIAVKVARFAIIRLAITAVTSLTAVIGPFALILPLIGAITIGIGFLIRKFMELSPVQDTIAKNVDKWSLAWENVKVAIQSVWEFLQNVVFEGMKLILDAFGTDLVGVTDTMTEGFAKMGDAVTDFALTASQWFRVIGKNIPLTFDIIKASGILAMSELGDVWTNTISNFPVVWDAAMRAMVFGIRARFREIILAIRNLSKSFVLLGKAAAASLEGNIKAAATFANVAIIRATQASRGFSGIGSTIATVKEFQRILREEGVDLGRDSERTKQAKADLKALTDIMLAKFTALQREQAKQLEKVDTPKPPGRDPDDIQAGGGEKKVQKVKFEAAFVGIQEFSNLIQQKMLDEFNKTNDTDAKILDVNKRQENHLEQINANTKKAAEKNVGLQEGGVAA